MPVYPKFIKSFIRKVYHTVAFSNVSAVALLWIIISPSVMKSRPISEMLPPVMLKGGDEMVKPDVSALLVTFVKAVLACKSLI